jgi:BirA family biotin operon repressor/biotin-[acetyl-CoA-carboxylase] ligase
VLCFDEVDSTNDVAWDSARQADTDGLVILAESQRAGRGRMGRSWLSPPGANLLMSVLLRDSGTGLRHEALTIAAGLSAAEGIEEACGLHTELKWPNDVLLDGAKVAGVLVERREADGGVALVVGVGVNVAWSPPPERVDAPATHLAAHLSHPADRAETARAILRRLDAWVDAIARGDLRALHDAWVGRCGMLGERVAVLSGGRRRVGRVWDVHPLEGLVLVDDHGTRAVLPAAGASIVRE